MTLVDTIGPAERTYTAPPGTGVQFWRIGAYDAEQETQSDKLALSFQVKIMTNDVLTSVMNALNNLDDRYSRCLRRDRRIWRV